MYKLFFIGTGKMATAIAGGIVRSGVVACNEMAGFDIDQAAAELFEKNTGIKAFSDDLRSVLEDAEVVLIAVKPQMIRSALKDLQGILQGKTVFSIAAGVTISQLQELTASGRIIRIMPNTPALVGCGAAGFSASPEAEETDIEFAGAILKAVGEAFLLPESQLDAVTALSGSGPAYVFEFIQALADGGVAEGLPRDVALKLAARTVAGAASMVLQSDLHPQQLKDNVTSPGGTTSRALELMAERGFNGIVMQSVRAAAARARELGGK